MINIFIYEGRCLILMDWQSYWAAFSTRAELEAIIALIKEHNALAKHMAFGEPLASFCIAKLDKDCGAPYCFLMGHESNQGATLAFFEEKGGSIRGFEAKDKEIMEGLKLCDLEMVADELYPKPQSKPKIKLTFRAKPVSVQA